MTGLRAAKCHAALAEFGRLLNQYGDFHLGIDAGDLHHAIDRPRTRYRVTRRGNVHDDIANASVFHTWGMGTQAERHVIAQRWIDAHAQVDK